MWFFFVSFCWCWTYQSLFKCFPFPCVRYIFSGICNFWFGTEFWQIFDVQNQPCFPCWNFKLFSAIAFFCYFFKILSFSFGVIFFSFSSFENSHLLCNAIKKKIVIKVLFCNGQLHESYSGIESIQAKIKIFSLSKF